MNPKEKQGALEDLSLAPIVRLGYLLKRQESLLSNKTLIRSLPDKGVKVRAFAEDLRERIKLRVENNDDSADKLAASFKSKVNIRPESDSSASSSSANKVITNTFEYDGQNFSSNRSNENDDANGGDILTEPGHDLREKKISFEVAESSLENDMEKDRVEGVNSMEGVPGENEPSLRMPSRFVASRGMKSGSEEEPVLMGIRLALKEEATEKKNILAEIFSENRSQYSGSNFQPQNPASKPPPLKSIFRENVPLKNSSIPSIPKPASIQRLISNRQSTQPSDNPSIRDQQHPVEDAIHSPVNCVFKEAKGISLPASIALQKKLKSANESRIFEDAAARLVERLRGQALPSKVDGGDVHKDKPVVDSAVALQLLGPRMAEKAVQDAMRTRGGFGDGNSVEGSFVEYREKTDNDDDIDDALGDDENENCFDDS